MRKTVLSIPIASEPGAYGLNNFTALKPRRGIFYFGEENTLQKDPNEDTIFLAIRKNKVQSLIYIPQK